MFCFLSLVSAGMLSFLNQQQLAYMTQMPELQYKPGQKYLVYNWPFSLSPTTKLSPPVVCETIFLDHVFSLGSRHLVSLPSPFTLGLSPP